MVRKGGTEHSFFYLVWFAGELTLLFRRLWLQIWKLHIVFTGIGTKVRKGALEVKWCNPIILESIWNKYLPSFTKLNLPARGKNFTFSPSTFLEIRWFTDYSVDWKVGLKHYPLQNFDFDMITRFREKAKEKIITVILLPRRAPAG